MPGAEQRPGQVRPTGLPNFQQFEPGGIHTPGSGNGEGRGLQGSTNPLQSGELLGKPETHLGGTPIVTVRVVNGIPQDVPHLYVDSRGGQTRWWVERESIESWQERGRKAKESGDEWYKDVSPDRIPSSVTHNYPRIPARVLELHPEYRDREWVTLDYLLTPTQEEQGRVALAPNQEGEVVLEKYTFLNTAPVSKDETTSFRRSLRVVEVPTLRIPEENSDQVFLWREIPEEPLSPDQGEPNPQTLAEDE